MSAAHDRLRALWLSRWPVRDERLVAFVVPTRDEEAGADGMPEVLRDWLGGTLPHYMVPDRIFVVDALPVTAAGKVDRRALRPPVTGAEVARPVRVPRTATEQAMATLFGQVLGARPDSMDDDFFADLGGHSLAATRLATLIRRAWPIAFPLRAVFERPTVAGLAAYVEQAGSEDPAGTAIQRQPRRSESGTGIGGSGGNGAATD